MKNTVTILSAMSLALLLGACGSSTPRTAATSNGTKIPAGLSIRDTPGRWFVELSGDPTSLSSLSVGSQQATFRAQAAQRGIVYQELRSFSTLFNGFSVMAKRSEIGRISQMPGVVGVYPIHRVTVPRSAPNLGTALSPDMFYARGMTGADIAQNELGLTGQGVKVGVIDTGIDMQHPAFAGRVVAGYDFVGDAYGTNDTYNPVPDNDPDDCDGHGTHVSGIVGGNDTGNNFKGVAPGVSFGAYRVFGCVGSSYDDVILAAMERARDDGMQVLNMSLGSPFDSWSEGPLAQAGTRLVKQGVVVVASAGNSGADGQYSMGGPSMGDNVISVASIGNVKNTLDAFTITPDGSQIGQILVSTVPLPAIGLTLPIAKLSTSTPATTNDGCLVTGTGANPYAANSMAGKAVLIRRGGCTFREKVLNAEAAGAKAVIIYNNAAGYVSPDLSGSPAITIPVSTVSAADGAKIDGLIAGGVSVKYDYKTIVSDNATANTLDTYSSYGMSAELELKPDIAAPGGSIRSTVPLSVRPDGYDTYSGTSMASPHVAGAAALLLQAHPTIKSKDMRALLMNTASLRYYRDDAGTVMTDIPDYVARQGAGMVDIVAAVKNTVQATPSKLSLGESSTFATRSKVVVLRNTGTASQTFTVKHVPARTIAGTTLTPVPDSSKATMNINGTDLAAGTLDITVPAGGEAELNVLVTPPGAAPDKSQYGGYISLTSATAGNLVVPYSGFKGDYQSIQVLGDLSLGGSTYYNAPLLFDDKAETFYEEGEVPAAPIDYNFQDFVPDPTEPDTVYNDSPYIIAQISHQARSLTFELLNGNGTLVETLDKQSYLPRNCTNNLAQTSASCDGYNFYSWNGKLSGDKDAANGTYKLRIKVLKALGDPGNAADTETYTSQPFNVARP